ncbi:MAG TPA: CBO0543 family protein [Bacillales bacterium]
MEKTQNRLALIFLAGIGAVLIPFWIRKPPLKDWTIVFLLAGFLSGMLDLFVTANKLIQYPVQLFGRKINVSLLFDYLLFPSLVVFYNQVSYPSRFWGALAEAFYFSIPMTIFEHWLEGHTKLIEWKKWNWFYTFITVTLMLWLGRGFMAVIRKFSRFTRQPKKIIIKVRG